MGVEARLARSPVQLLLVHPQQDPSLQPHLLLQRLALGSTGMGAEARLNAQWLSLYQFSRVEANKYFQAIRRGKVNSAVICSTRITLEGRRDREVDVLFSHHSITPIFTNQLLSITKSIRIWSRTKSRTACSL